MMVSVVWIAPKEVEETVRASKARRQGSHETSSKNKDLDMHCIFSLAR